jgi:enterochelin esterase-like enzyme
MGTLWTRHLTSATAVERFDTKTTYDGVFSDPARFNKRVKLLWLGAGSEERELHASISDAVEALRRSGVRVVFFESAGTAHEWQTWRRDLRDLAARLFR